MRPRDTCYRLVASPRDYGRCHALATAQALPEQRYNWPTVLAERDGHLMGFLSTDTTQGELMAGPLVVNGTVRKPVITIIRLIEAYEVVLRLAQMSYYRFAVERGNDAWRRILAKVGLRPDQVTDDHYWYMRRLT